jgi:RimJ/RimL family protein N-acetyltransferase
VSAPLLRSERFELWVPRKEDLAGLYALTEDPEVRRFLGTMTPSEMDSAHRLLRGAGSWLLYGYGPFYVRVPGDDRIVANCGLFHSWRGFGKGMDDVAEAGWIVHRDYWGQRIAGEVMDTVMRWFDATHGPRRTTCMIDKDHAASQKVAAALGFVAYDTHEAEDDGAEVILYERARG